MQQIRTAADLSTTLDEDYGVAVVRLAWAVDRKSQARVLLCAAVELLPREIPPPLVRPERRTVVSRRFFLYARDVVVSARRGVKWFEDCARGIAVRPNDAGAFLDADPAAPRFVLQPFDAEPPGAALVTGRTRVPFSADWQLSVRAKHLVSGESPFRGWTREERTATVEWLLRDCHIDLDTLPEYAGSIHLLAPNPVFRSLFVRHEQATSSLIVALTPRAGRSVVGLTLLVEEKRATGVGVMASATLEEPVVRIELPYFPGEIRERVVDPRRGLLYDGHFGMFGVGFNLNMQLVARNRRVDPGGAAEPYDVSVVESCAVSQVVGLGASAGSAAPLLAHAATRRRRLQRGDAYQKWFRDQAPDAVRALRELVSRAKGGVFICDPYFGANDLLRVVLAVADPETAVRILTSARHLKNDDGAVGDVLEARLAEVRAAPPMSPIDIHVMPGKDPPIHDRFIVLDDVTWMLGSSINHFGERGTLMVVVPYPEPVRGDLEAIWATSPTLADWLGQRRALVPPP